MDKSTLVRIVFSIEEQPIGLCRHISISLDASKFLPSTKSMNKIIKKFGFEEEIDNCYVYVEEFDYANAVNIIEPIKELPIEK